MPTFPDIPKAKQDLATYILADYSPSWAIAKVVADYRLWNWANSGNAWIDNMLSVYGKTVRMHSYL